jgi:drug/metabolite transporter (DMT)-like permease
LTISGSIGLLLGDTYLFKAFKESGPRISMLIMSSNPALAAVLAYLFLGETLSLWGILGIAITLTGISIVVLEEPLEGIHYKFKVTRKGVIFGMLAAIGQAVGLIFAKLAYFEGNMHSITATFVRITSALIIMIPFIMFSGQMKNPIKLFSKDLKSLGLVFTGSIIGPYLGITFSYIAIVYTKIGIASTLMSTVPILMLPLAVIIYKEKLSYKAIIGAFLAVGGVSILFLK